MPTYSVEPNPQIKCKILHEDEEVLVLVKPPGIPTQPGRGHENDTILNGLFATHSKLLQNLGAGRDFGLLHRLDKNASGLLIVALKNRAYDALREAFATRRIKKFYWAVCSKAPKETTGVIRLSIAEEGGIPSSARGSGTPKTAKISRAGKPAVTAYRVLDVSPSGALVEARPVTGRLHQVRIHLEAIGCPILGDEFYASKHVKGASARLALHAHRIAFLHPTTGQPVDVRTAWPSDLRSLLTRLRLQRPDLPPPNEKVPGTDEPASPAQTGAPSLDDLDPPADVDLGPADEVEGALDADE